MYLHGRAKSRRHSRRKSRAAAGFEPLSGMGAGPQAHGRLALTRPDTRTLGDLTPPGARSDTGSCLPLSLVSSSSPHPQSASPSLRHRHPRPRPRHALGSSCIPRHAHPVPPHKRHPARPLLHVSRLDGRPNLRPRLTLDVTSLLTRSPASHPPSPPLFVQTGSHTPLQPAHRPWSRQPKVRIRLPQAAMSLFATTLPAPASGAVRLHQQHARLAACRAGAARPSPSSKLHAAFVLPRGRHPDQARRQTRPVPQEIDTDPGTCPSNPRRQ